MSKMLAQIIETQTHSKATQLFGELSYLPLGLRPLPQGVALAGCSRIEPGDEALEEEL